MSWRDELWNGGDASFRSATFKVKSTDTGFGRKNAVHSYPLKDEVYVEDLGLDADEFSVVGYIVQNTENDQNYFTERDLLIEALKGPGPGTLIHPFLGEREVSLIGKARMTETFDQGGIARFTMTFLLSEGTEAPFPDQVIDHISSIDEAAEYSFDDLLDGFAEFYNPEGAPGFSLSSVIDSISTLNSMMKSAIASIKNLGPAAMARALAVITVEFSGILSAVNQACSLANSVINMFNGIASLVGMYGDIFVDNLLGACSSAVRGISSGPMSGAKVELPETGFKASTISEPALIDEGLGKSAARASLAIADYGKDLGASDINQYGGGLEPVLITTVTRARQAANQLAIINMTRAIAIIMAIRIAVRIDYESYNSAIEMQNEITEILDAQLLKLGEDAVNTDYGSYNIATSDPFSYEALVSIRPVFVKSMNQIGASLAKIVDYMIPADTLPSLVLAYEQYQDIDREKDIINRNLPLVQHPGFLPNGQMIEILSE